MFDEKIKERIDMLDVNLVKQSDSDFTLREIKKEGEAELKVEIKNPGILFEKLEGKKLGYFNNQKCADFLLYENCGNRWRIHIFEMKRSIAENEWKKIKAQFAGALQNAQAIAGFLGINVDYSDINVYSVFRYDKIHDVSNPAMLRMQNVSRAEREKNQETADWDSSTIKLDFPGINSVNHIKVTLDKQNGTGSCVIS